MNPNSALVPSLVFILTLGFSLTTEAAEFTTADGNGSDNQVMGFGNDRESLNKGGAGNLELRSHVYSGNNFYGVLRFDLASREAGTIEAAVLSVTTLDVPKAEGRVFAYGLVDGYTGGPDERGGDELGETDFVEGGKEWHAAEGSELNGDNAPGFAEDRPSIDGFDRPGTPFKKLGVFDVHADLPAGATLEFTSDAFALWLATDTNQTVVIYLVSDGAWLPLGTKESGKPATLTID